MEFDEQMQADRAAAEALDALMSALQRGETLPATPLAAEESALLGAVIGVIQAERGYEAFAASLEAKLRAQPRPTAALSPKRNAMPRRFSWRMAASLVALVVFVFSIAIFLLGEGDSGEERVSGEPTAAVVQTSALLQTDVAGTSRVETRAVEAATLIAYAPSMTPEPTSSPLPMTVTATYNLGGGWDDGGFVGDWPTPTATRDGGGGFSPTQLAPSTLQANPVTMQVTQVAGMLTATAPSTMANLTTPTRTATPTPTVTPTMTGTPNPTNTALPIGTPAPSTPPRIARMTATAPPSPTMTSTPIVAQGVEIQFVVVVEGDPTFALNVVEDTLRTISVPFAPYAFLTRPQGGFALYQAVDTAANGASTVRRVDTSEDIIGLAAVLPLYKSQIPAQEDDNPLVVLEEIALAAGDLPRVVIVLWDYGLDMPDSQEVLEAIAAGDTPVYVLDLSAVQGESGVFMRVLAEASGGDYAVLPIAVAEPSTAARRLLWAWIGAAIEATR